MRYAVAILVVGMMMGVGAWVAAQERQGNPQRGQAIYERQCAGCHGIAGDGAGPEARTLIVPPANFHQPKHQVKTDQELFLAIADGVLFSPMHGWRGRLSTQDIEDVIGYLRAMVPFLPLS